MILIWAISQVDRYKALHFAKKVPHRQERNLNRHPTKTPSLPYIYTQQMKNHKTIPPPLKKGDTIAILSTARKVDRPFIEFTTKFLQHKGYNVKWMDNLFSEYHQFSGTDQQRAADLQAAINDPQIKAILCGRGGYGSVRLLPLVDFSPLLEQPKWICGYSDVTSIHAHLNQLGVASLHSTMPVNFEANSKEALDTLFNHLTGEPTNIECNPYPFNKNGAATGELVGGNLSIIYSLTGTSSSIQTEGKILLLEDLDEYLYHIDRMMMNLKLSGLLENLAGLVVGAMSDMNDNTIPFGSTAYEIIRDAVAEYNYPVCFDFPFGHIDDNRAWISGKTAQLDILPTGIQLQQ